MCCCCCCCSYGCSCLLNHIALIHYFCDVHLKQLSTKLIKLLWSFLFVASIFDHKCSTGLKAMSLGIITMTLSIPKILIEKFQIRFQNLSMFLDGIGMGFKKIGINICFKKIWNKNARKSTRRCAGFTCIDCIQCIDCIDCGDCRMYGLQRLYTYMDMDCRDQQLKISHKTFCEIFPLRNLLC